MANENAGTSQGIDSFLSMGQYAPEQDINALLTPKPQEQQPVPSAQGRSSPYDELFQKAEAKYGLPAGVLSSIGFTESSFNPNAVNKTSGAAGLMGFMPRTAKEYGINPNIPDEAVDAAGKKVAGLRKYYNGDMAKALAGYNAGERRVNNAVRTAGDDWISKLRPETQDYITKILGGQTQAPQVETYDIPLLSGKTLKVPTSISREDALAEAKANGIDAIGLRELPLANGSKLRIPDNITDEDALAEAKGLHPDLDFTTQAEAELAKKHELIPAFKSGVLQSTGQILQGVGEWSEDINPLKPASDWAKQKGAEYATKAEGMYVPTSDAEAAKHGMYGSVHQSVLEPLAQGAGSLAPLAAAYAVPGVGPVLGTAAIGLQETGAMANEAEQEGRTFSKAEALPYIAGSTVLNMIGIKDLGPLRNAFSEEFSVGAQQAIKSALEKGGVEEASKVVGSKLGNIAKNVGVTSGAFASGDIGTRVLERIYAGKSIDSDEAFTEYGDILKSDLPLGVVAGGVHGHIAHAGKQGALEQTQVEAATPAVAPQPIQPEVNEQGYTQDIQTKLNEAKLAEEARAAQAAKDAQTTVTTDQGATTTDQGATTATTAQETQGVQEEQGATTEEVIAEPTLRKPEEVKLTDIPYHTSQWTPDDINNPQGPGSAKRSEGVAKIVDIAGRKTVTADVNGVKVPFYLSTGAGGKKDVPSGKWYPMFGIGEDGWFNKKSGKNVTSYYGSPELKKVAELLDATYGDIRLDKTVPQTSATGSHIAAINEGLAPTSNGHANTRIELDANIKNTLARIAGKAPEVTEAPHWADALGLTPSSAKYKQLKQLDINDTDHHSAIKNILDSAARLNMKIDPTAVEGLYKQLDAISPEETSKKKLDFGEALGYGWKPQVDREGRINAKLKGVENEPLRNAVHSSDMGQTIDALSQSKNPIIRHLAEASKNLTDLTIKSGVMPGKKKNAGGAYEPAAHLITMNPKYAGNEAIVGHELLHANVYHAIENPTQKQKPAVAGLTKLHATVKNHPTLAKEYGLKDVHEFVSEGLTNPEFQYKLKKIKYENTTMWGKFTQSIADMLGLKRDNAFVELLTHTENLLPSEPVRRGKDTKGGKPLYNEQERTDADKISKATTPNVSRSTQPEVRQEGKGAPISSERIREGRPETGQVEKVTHGININDKEQAFTDQILAGEKTIETRDSNSLKPYIGKRMGLIKTGKGKAMHVGYATVGEPKVYDSEAKFRADEDKHLVSKGTFHDISDKKYGRPLKYGYPLTDIEAITPVPVTSEGHVARVLPETKEKVGKVSDKYSNITEGQKTRLDMTPNETAKRIDALTEAARKIALGEMTNPEYQELVKKYKPVTAYNYVPKPETNEDMWNALYVNKRDKLNQPIKEGEVVDTRLDIPAYSKGTESAWVPTIHKKNVVISHRSTVILNNVTMHLNEKAALAIATRKPRTNKITGEITPTDKSSIATVKGEWENHTPEQAYAEATKIMDDYNKGIGNWRQAGMDPERHSHFYDRETEQPIVGGDRLIQIGPLVLIKNPIRGDKAKEDYLYSEVAPDEPGLGRLRSADILVDRSPKGEELKKQRDKDIEKAQMAVNDQSTLGRTLNKIRSRFIAHDSALDYATREDKTFQANGEFHERILRNQAKERRNFISSAIEHGIVTRSSTGMLTINRSEALNLVNILDRAHDLPKGFKAEDVERILTVLANEGHQIRYQDIERRAVQRRADAAKLVTFAKTFPKGSLERKSSLATAQEIRKLANSDQRRVDAIKEKGGIGQHITSEMVADAHSVMNSVPEIKAIVDDVHKVMQSLVDLLESTGNIDASVAREWRNPKYQYAPLYMSTDELESIGESNIHISSAVKGIGKVKAKGVSEHRINMFENLQKHYAFAVDAAMENNYKSASLNWLAAHGSARELASNKGSQFQQVVSILRNGKSVMFAIDDPVLFDAFKDIARLELPAFITAPSMVVRKGALVNPMFWYRQLIRDPFMANFTAQTGLVTPFGAARSFLSILTNHNAEYKELVNKGVLQSQSNLADQKLDFIKGKKQRSNIQKGWSFAQHVHEAADAATRVEVYKAALKEAKKIGGLTKEQQSDFAVSRARDFMSFANQGSDASVRMINQSVPFFNSFLNGMDVLLRNATGMNMSKADATKARKIFWTRAMYMTAASMAYSYTLSSNSQDYRDAKPDDWMNNWLMPGLGDKRMGKAASPFEIGIAFKLIPEAMVRQLMGLDTGTRSNELLFNAVLNGLTPPLPIPAFAKPILEAVTGKSMFGKNPAEWFDIESPGAKNLVRAERGRGKSYIADAFSDLTGMSPAISQTLLKGYGTEVYNVADMIANGLSRGIGEGLGKDWTETVPYAKAFVTNPNALSDQNEVYSQAEKYKQLSSTLTHLLRVGDPRAALYATDENMPALYGSKAEAKILGAMTKLNQAMAYTENDTSMPIEEKRKQMEELLAMKRNILDMGMGVIKKVEED
ncbi:LT_GEWL domain containing protein [uncultured Caudovirales phage]|uniref:LT_GEWL domain containing protein n=1 Tax=uncultured Caudovirales phage TaxID=2100421 RepID=A0A6J5QDC6_9CAUD|nr:LT_GEWL domain containing protein [uncultured Caudovirales phage]